MRKLSISSVVIAAALLGLPTLASAQMPADDPHHPGTAAGEEQRPSGPGGMMGQQMMGMMPQGMMGPGMGMGQDIMARMGQDKMGGMAPGMIGAMMACPMMAAMAGDHMSDHMPMMAMMHRTMGAAMHSMLEQGSAAMGPGAMGGGLGVVTPSQHLSVDDVRDYFEHRLETQGNPRLRIGEVSQSDDDTIMAEIVTADGSLVDRFSIDRHTGVIQRAE